MEAILNGLSVTQRRFEVGDPSSVSFARRGISDAAHGLGFSDALLGKLAIIVTECATNQLKHAQRGELLVRPIVSAVTAASGLPVSSGVELLAIDSGPGIRDLHACFVDGYTTAGSPGNGMGAIQRLSDELDIWSAPGLGTMLRIVVWADAGAAAPDSQAPISYGAINLPLQGETLCGDAWTCGYADGEFVVLVADGLGHGPLANTAALAATEAFAQLGTSNVVEIVEASHVALRATRGAALGVASIPALDAADGAPGIARFCGVGNIAASVWTPSGHRHLVSHAGIVGHQMRKAQESQVDWPRDGLLILHSDGLATRWDLSKYPGLAHRHPTLVAAALYRDFVRGRDDVTVFVARVARMGDL
ncbi:anti-sigma regulatory factor (Ser/Thr protein kinase) [Paraburkholderia sp. EB58]|jgi:anti-sigma regulatory factor (Ser/Thr protein kinase)|uniref:ATP-binding protein n=1 Tax=Paraburkholderia sp. EB58 TaxID=3035125 RepID=UPI003D209ECE